MERTEKKEKNDFLTFPVLVGIFVYFVAITVAMAIYWQTGIWYQNPGLTSIGTIFGVVLVGSIIVFVGVFAMKKRRLTKPISYSST